MKKVMSVFKRDLRIASRDGMALWIMFAPILLAIIILFVSPGINDSTLNLAVLDTLPSDEIQAFETLANVEIYHDVERIRERVEKRDEVIGVIYENGEVTLIAQGNESENGLEMAKLIVSMYKLDSFSATSNLSYYSFGETIPQLKLSLSVALIFMDAMLASMLIVLGLVDEKSDNTIRAANVAPIRQTAYVLSKSIIGVLALFILSITCLLMLGMWHINWLQMVIMIISCGALTIIVGYLIGLSSSDFIEAAASLKMIMMPAFAGILVFELAPENWHWTVWWDPFYWAYRGMTEIINKTASWGSIGFYTAVIWLICILVFALATRKIRTLLN